MKSTSSLIQSKLERGLKFKEDYKKALKITFCVYQHGDESKIGEDDEQPESRKANKQFTELPNAKSWKHEKKLSIVLKRLHH